MRQIHPERVRSVMANASEWFSENSEESGCGFSLRINKKLYEEQSEYQKIEIFETSEWGNLMVIDGCIMLTGKDNFLYHEMMTHPALFTHADPCHVAIIGGGDCGALREVLKHSEVEKVTQIDIDERVTRLSERYFPELCESNQDFRAELLFIDGIKWMQVAAPGSLDVIIVDSTDPIGPGEVLFSEDFYRACFNALGDGGLLVQQSESPLIHQSILRRMYRDMDLAGFDDSKTLFFPQPVYPSGWWSATMACKGGVIDGFREEAVSYREFETLYYNLEIHRGAFAVPGFFKTISQLK